MKHILVVDDEKYIRQGLKSMIEHALPPKTIEVQVARNGQEAYDMLVRDTFDMLFTDINMPHMDGIELISKARETSNNLVVVIISGYNDFDYAVAGLRYGVVDYLLKPITRDKVKIILERYILDINHNDQGDKFKRDLLVRDIKCVLLTPYAVNEDITDIKLRLFQILNAEFCTVICMSRKLNLQKSHMANCEEQALYVPNIAHRHFLFVSNAIDVKQIELPIFSGMARLNANDSFLLVCKQSEVAMKRAFLKDISFYKWDGNIASNKPTLSDTTKLVNFVTEGRIVELQQYLESKIDMDAPDYLEKLMTSMLEMLEEYFPKLKTDYNVIKTALMNPYQYASLKAYLSEMYGYLYILSGDIKITSELHADQQLEVAINYIHKNYKNDISLAMVAEHIDRNYSSLSRDFKKYTGKSFVDYLKIVRLNKACELLQSSDEKVVDIAEMVGFYNERYFSKVFKETMGITPSGYRILQQQAEHNG